MADQKKMTAFRLDEALLRRLDKYAARMAEDTGLPVSRADVVRLLLLRGLDVAEQAQAKSRR